MRTEKNETGAEKKVAEAFDPKHPEEDKSLNPLKFQQKAEPAVSEPEAFDEYDQEKQGQTEGWHTFKTP